MKQLLHYTVMGLCLSMWSLSLIYGSDEENNDCNKKISNSIDFENISDDEDRKNFEEYRRADKNACTRFDSNECGEANIFNAKSSLNDLLKRTLSIPREPNQTDIFSSSDSDEEDSYNMKYECYTDADEENLKYNIKHSYCDECVNIFKFKPYDPLPLGILSTKNYNHQREESAYKNSNSSENFMPESSKRRFSVPDEFVLHSKTNDVNTNNLHLSSLINSKRLNFNYSYEFLKEQAKKTESGKREEKANAFRAKLKRDIGSTYMANDFDDEGDELNFKKNKKIIYLSHLESAITEKMAYYYMRKNDVIKALACLEQAAYEKNIRAALLLIKIAEDGLQDHNKKTPEELIELKESHAKYLKIYNELLNYEFRNIDFNKCYKQNINLKKVILPCHMCNRQLIEVSSIITEDILNNEVNTKLSEIRGIYTGNKKYSNDKKKTKKSDLYYIFI